MFDRSCATDAARLHMDHGEAAAVAPLSAMNDALEAGATDAAAEAEARRVAEQEAAEQVARLARAAAAQGYDVAR